MIEFNGDNSVLFHMIDAEKYYSTDAVVVVPMTHVAFIIQNGALREKVSGGSVPLYNETKIRGIFRKKSGVAVHSLKIIYISKTARLTVHWGTNINQRITYVEPTSKRNVSVGAFGMMDISIRDAEKFYLELVAAENDYSVERLQNRIRNLTVNETFRTVKKILDDRNPAYTEFSVAKDDIQDRVGELLSEKYVNDFGFNITNFIIENLNIDEESLKELDKRNIEDSEYDRRETIYQREKDAERRRQKDRLDDLEKNDLLYNHDLNREREKHEYERKLRHEDEDRTWAREDKAADREERMYNKGVEALRDIEIKRSEAEAKIAENTKQGNGNLANAGHHCIVCGAAYKPGAKYCPDCGAPLPREDLKIKCPGCGMELSWGTKYCPYCRNKLDD